MFYALIAMRTWLTVVLIVVALASPASAGKEKQSAFQDACADFAKLLRRNDSPREQWLQVIKKFVALHKHAKDPTVRTRALLLAGKAALDLHKRTGHAGDLEFAIRSLDQFCRSCRHSPELHHGVRLLREARAIKERLKTHPSESFVAEAPPPVAIQSRPQPPVLSSSAGAQAPWTNAAARAPMPTGPPPAPQASRVGPPTLPESPTGNPFCASGQKRSLFRIPLPERHAAIPQRSVTDVPRPAVQCPPPPKHFVVVIDPGHGGKDPGAVSSDGRLKEKDITLKVAFELKRILERTNPLVKIVLTRDKDEFVTLEDRKAIANSKKADLFVSIHCNSSTESVARGIETYYFSTPSSRRAMDLAARENRSAAHKGMGARTLKPNHTQDMTPSISLAGLVHRGVMEKLGGTASGGRDRGVKSGPFHILHATKMPSILIECSFISNPTERIKLKDPIYLQGLAEGIAGGTNNYLRDLDKKG